MAERRRHAPWAWLGVVAWAVALVALSASPGGSGSLDFAWRFAGDDKVVHAGLYAVLGALLRLATGRTRWAVALGSAFGVSDEIHQAFVPGRHADPWDWVADTLGAATGALLVASFARAREKRAVD